MTVLFVYFQDRVYVQQNNVESVYDLGLILFKDLVGVLSIYTFSGGIVFMILKGL